MLFTDHERTDVARVTLLRTIQRRLEQPDVLQAAADVKTALDKVDAADWVSCLRWACVLADQSAGREVVIQG